MSVTSTYTRGPPKDCSIACSTSLASLACRRAQRATWRAPKTIRSSSDSHPCVHRRRRRCQSSLINTNKRHGGRFRRPSAFSINISAAAAAAADATRSSPRRSGDCRRPLLGQSADKMTPSGTSETSVAIERRHGYSAEFQEVSTHRVQKRSIWFCHLALVTIKTVWTTFIHHGR